MSCKKPCRELTLNGNCFDPAPGDIPPGRNTMFETSPTGFGLSPMSSPFEFAFGIAPSAASGSGLNQDVRSIISFNSDIGQTGSSQSSSPEVSSSAEATGKGSTTGRVPTTRTPATANNYPPQSKTVLYVGLGVAVLAVGYYLMKD